MRHRRLRSAAAAGVVLVLVGACSNGDQGAATSTSAATSTTAAPTTATTAPIATAPTTTAPPDAPPSTGLGGPTSTGDGTASTTAPVARSTLATTGEDFETIAKEIVAYRIWLGENPDPNLLGNIYLAECPCYEPVHKALVNLSTAGERFDDAGAEVVNVELMDRLGPDAVRLIVIQKSNGLARVVNAKGEAVEEGTGRVPPPEADRYYLKRGSDGRWRVSDVFVLGPATPEQLEGA